VNAEETFQFIKDYGPAFAGFMCTVLSFVIGVSFRVLKKYWSSYVEKVNAAATLAIELEKSLTASKETIHNKFIDIQQMIMKNRELGTEEHKEHWEYIQQLRSELAMHVRTNELTNKSVNALEGIVGVQNKDLKEYTKLVDRLVGKIDAIFRYIDTPKRATDVES
jgi:hypothetical protein